ncbi:MAG: hypothetical protein H6740_07900 [Alphaproteobacteria bacterium]|nr:hypothetical protein [Alphaproteobacteria bacterium]
MLAGDARCRRSITPETRLRVAAERAFLRTLEGGCSVPGGRPACTGHAWLPGRRASQRGLG